MIDIHSHPGPICLKVEPGTGKRGIDEERSWGIQRSPENDPRANPQYWACKERLDNGKAKKGRDARHQALMKMCRTANFRLPNSGTSMRPTHFAGITASPYCRRFSSFTVCAPRQIYASRR